jgi:hypothetical protein
MRCESEPDIDKDFAQCGKLKRTFSEDDPVGDLLTYLCRLRTWANKIVAIAHNAKAFDLHFILKNAISLKWQPELIMNGRKILCIRMEHLLSKTVSQPCDDVTPSAGSIWP